jgi:hypothetical protein
MVNEKCELEYESRSMASSRGQGSWGGWFYVVPDYRHWPLGSLRTKHLPETPRLNGLVGYALGLDILAMA